MITVSVPLALAQQVRLAECVVGVTFVVTVKILRSVFSVAFVHSSNSSLSFAPSVCLESFLGEPEIQQPPMERTRSEAPGAGADTQVRRPHNDRERTPRTSRELAAFSMAFCI